LYENAHGSEYALIAQKGGDRPGGRRIRIVGQALLKSCPHRPPCPGCPRFGEPGIAPAARGALDELARSHGLPPVQVVSGPTAGFRHRARLAIRGRLSTPKLGLFEMDTHRVVHIPNCSVHHPLINQVANVVRRALVDARVTSYSDGAHLGLARYLQVVVERSSQTAQVVIVANSATPEPLAECASLIRERLGADLHSLWFNSNLERSNTILGTDFHRWFGPEGVVERFGGAAVHYPPGAFGQNNLDVAELIIAHVREQIPVGSRVVEFYAGVGAIGLSVLQQVGDITLNELSPDSLHGLELGLAQLNAAERAKISVLPGEAAIKPESDFQIVIADPPRKGLSPELMEHLGNHPPEGLIYISCGLESLLRDAAQLISRGKLRLVSLTAFNLMPFTEHVETVARFERG
jgi:tRNA/tmRNA/rRNA uracil-C5-methylase (TrmA/RlmC/RlmD family)